MGLGWHFFSEVCVVGGVGMWSFRRLAERDDFFAIACV